MMWHVWLLLFCLQCSLAKGSRFAALFILLKFLLGVQCLSSLFVLLPVAATFLFGFSDSLYC